VSWLRIFFAARQPGVAPPPLWARALNFAIALLAISLVFYFSFQQLAYRLHWDYLSRYWRVYLNGWLMTILISLGALFLSTCLGLFFALGQRSRFLPLQYFSRIYVELIRGTPLLVQIMIFFYVVANAFHLDNRYIAGVLILSFFSGAYISEIIRAGIESVGASQLESARAIGLTRSQTYRYVIFPQALRQILPPLAGQFVSLIKDSSLLSIISIQEFAFAAKLANSDTYSTLETYLPLAIGYLILTLPISMWTRSLERRHKYET
jgi:polar amino acid transport system permease protein